MGEGVGHGTRENGKGTGKGLKELFAGTNKSGAVE